VRKISRSILTVIVICILISCIPGISNDTPATVTLSGALPAAILQTGEHPLWFVLTEKGPLHINSLDDLFFDESFSHAFIPWTYALHIRFLQETDDGIIMAVNRDGFLKLTQNTARIQGRPVTNLILYHFPGGQYFKPYTIGGFVLYENNPTALLYLDNRFMDVTSPFPQSRKWTFNMNSNITFPVRIPALQPFFDEEGWEVDTLRAGSDGLFYYRAVRRSGTRPEIKMYRTADLTQAGMEISADVFFNSIPRQNVILHPSLPPLPEGFAYTMTAFVGDSLFAAWEEQADFNIAAAGFMLIKR